MPVLGIELRSLSRPAHGLATLPTEKPQFADVLMKLDLPKLIKKGQYVSGVWVAQCNDEAKDRTVRGSNPGSGKKTRFSCSPEHMVLICCIILADSKDIFILIT